MIGLIGFDHQRANLQLRGRLSFADDRLCAALQSLLDADVVTEVAILSTCNRTEIYLAAPAWAPARAWAIAFLNETYQRGAASPPSRTPLPGARAGTAPDAAVTRIATDDAPPSDLAAALYLREEVEATQHLFRVAAGLESMVIGEAQILGQVKDALATAEAVGAAGEELRALFTAAIKAGKRVRSETEIGRADASVASLAVRVARESLGALRGQSALVIGAGKTSQLCARLLQAEDVGRLVLATRSPHTAADLARAIGAEAVALKDLASVIGDMRLVISATAAPHHVLSAAVVARGLGTRHTPIVMIDLAVPPDIEAAVGLLPQVSLYTLDTLRALDGAAGTADRPEGHDAAAAQAERILAEAVREYLRAQTLRKMVPGIAALRRHVDRSEQAELARALAQLDHLSPEEHAVIARLGQRLVDKMFHHLVSRIRSLAEYDEVPPQITMRVLARLFADPDAPTEGGE
ncbi:MAG: glutamyl-tRNA reductase [Ktedonobacterales bacterium]|nr:glutamyl-tRNA reductase [Ktedonobacterales bacterium]